jgi:hypothetical protein
MDNGGWNGSPEILLQTVSSGRMCTRRSGVQKELKTCHGGAPEGGKSSSAEKRGRRSGCLPGASPESVSPCGLASLRTCGLVAGKL